jgi:predicted outer membrane protein
MQNTRRTRWTSRIVPVVATTLLAWVLFPAASALAAPASPAQDVSRPVTAQDPFGGRTPGDVSDGKGDLPPAANAPSSGEVVQNAMPGDHVAQTRFGQIDDVDRLFLVKVRQAGLWERPTCLRAQQQAQSPRFKEACQAMASDHSALDEEDRFVAKQLGVALPDQPSADQQSWMREFWDLQGHDFDVDAVKWLRFAHGVVFSAIATVRASTRNEMVRLFAERANTMVNKHMSLLESTGLVQYDNLPRAAIGAPAAALASSTLPADKNPSFLRLPVIGLLIVTGLLALVSVRRVVRGS